MWHLVKAELQYNKRILVFLVQLILIYVVFSLTDIRIISALFLEKGSWGILFLTVSFISFYLIWLIRIQEKRTRLHLLLPVNTRMIGYSRFIFVQVIIWTILLLLGITIFLSSSSWLEDTDDIVFQIGGLIIVLSIILATIDVWFVFRDNLFIQLLAVIGFLTITIIPTYMIFVYMRPLFYEALGTMPGKVLYLLWGSVLLFITVKTFNKRKNYLL